MQNFTASKESQFIDFSLLSDKFLKACKSNQRNTDKDKQGPLMSYLNFTVFQNHHFPSCSKKG